MLRIKTTKQIGQDCKKGVNITNELCNCDLFKLKPQNKVDYKPRRPRKKKLNPLHECPHCKMDIRIRNPSGFCDHLHYPVNCEICMDFIRKD